MVELSKAPSEQPVRGLLGVADAYKAALQVAGRLDTPEGAQAMLLAEMLAAGNHTAAGAASLSRELRAAMQEAMQGAPQAADALDELSARRERKAGA